MTDHFSHSVCLLSCSGLIRIAVPYAARIHCLLCILAMSFAEVSCVNEEYTGPDPSLGRRTVLVWLDAGGRRADDGLAAEDPDACTAMDVSAACESRIEALRRSWRYTGGRCLIYYDPADAPPCLLSLRGGCSVTPVPYVETVAEYGDEDSADPAIFSRVLDYVVSSWPADSYGLVLTSGSFSWLPPGSLEDPDSFPETGSGTGMSLEGFAEAIPDGLLDFIIFESGLSAGIETAYALKDKSGYILASSAELLNPGFTDIYATHGSLLFDMSLPVGTALSSFGQAFADYVGTRQGDRRSMTLSLVRTSALSPLAEYVRGLLASVPSDMLPSGADLQPFDRPALYGLESGQHRFLDMGEWLDKLEEVAAAAGETGFSRLSESGEQAFRSGYDPVADAVVWKSATDYFMPSSGGFPIESHSGLTTYIPDGTFPLLDDAWSRTDWAVAVSPVR